MPPFWGHNNKRTYLFSKIFKVISSIDSSLLTKNDDIVGTIMRFLLIMGNNYVFFKITEANFMSHATALVEQYECQI